MIYSERQQGYRNKSDFNITKTLIGKIFEKYFKIDNPRDFTVYSSGSDTYDSEELELYFLKVTRKPKLNPQYFFVSVINDEYLFDIIECAIRFLYEEYSNDPNSRRYTNMLKSSGYARFINEICGILKDYGYVIQSGIIERMPDDGMLSLVESEIITIEPERFENKIEEAKRQFLDKNGTIETKKSACATLSAVVEYIRPKLVGTELNTDIDELMKIVNKMDIRHNNKATRILQAGNINDTNFIEWVFYSLLNCVNFYIKTRN